MKLHAPFLILAKAATQPAALPYQHGRTATGFSAARCHRAALPSCSGRPAARSGAEERKARRGTSTRELRTSRCPTQEAGPSRQPPPPASQPSQRTRGDTAPAGALTRSRPPQGAPPQHHGHPITPQPTCHRPRRCRRGDEEVRPPTAARGSNGCARPMAGGGRGGGWLPAAAGPFPHRDGRGGAGCRRDGRLQSAPRGRGICCVNLLLTAHVWSSWRPVLHNSIKWQTR